MGLGPGLVLTAAFWLRAAAIKHLEGERSLRAVAAVSHAQGRRGESGRSAREGTTTGEARLTVTLVVPHGVAASQLDEYGGEYQAWGQVPRTSGLENDQ